MKLHELISGVQKRSELAQTHRFDAVSKLLGLGFHVMPGAKGASSSILVHKNLSYIIKIFDINDLGYITFLRLIHSYKNNPHWPKLRGQPQQLSEHWAAVRLEKLYSFPNSKFEDIEMMLSNANSDPNWQKNITTDSIAGEFLNKWPAFADALNLLRRAQQATGQTVRLDWHEGNIMQRQDGCPVIIDPFASKNVDAPVIGEWQTIASATDAHGHVSREKSDAIIDPHGWFKKNKKNIRSSKFKPAGKGT